MHKKALATPRRPCSPEGRCAWARPQHAYATLNGHPERILPGHLGPAGAPRGGRHHAATIWGWRATPTKHEAAGRRRPRTSDYSRLGCHLGRRGAARPTVSAAPCRATHARPNAKKTSTPASNAACEGATRRPAPSEAACTPLQRKRPETSKFGKHSPKPPRLRACCCRRRPATPSPPLARASAG
jgi:hypothetical protein